MASYIIKIMVLNDVGDMAYGCSVQHVLAGDTITWSSETGSFALGFSGNPPPFSEGNSLQSGPGNTFTATVNASAPRGRYYYTVAATSNGKIYLDPGCPEVIIR